MGADEAGASGHECSHAQDIPSNEFARTPGRSGGNFARLRERSSGGSTRVRRVHRAFAVALLIATPVLGPASSSAGDAGAVRTLHVATGGAHGADCVRTPCSTFDRAYRLARPGDTILIRGGTYPAQQIDVDVGKLNSTRPVVFRVARGQSAFVDGELTMLGSNAVFNGERRRDGSYSLRARRVVSVATKLNDRLTAGHFPSSQGRDVRSHRHPPHHLQGGRLRVLTWLVGPGARLA